MDTPAPTPDTSALAQLSYELSLRTLTQQEAALNELRARTGTLVAAASIVASFLGSTAISKHGLDAWGAFALVAFVGSIALAIWVLLPREHLIFSVNGSALYEDAVRTDVFDLAETHRRLAYWLDGFHGENEAKVRPLFTSYRWAVGLLLLEVLFWSLQLALS